jgi:hypothetical protein
MGHLALERDRVFQIGLTDSYIYWVTYKHRDQIRRHALSAASTAEEVFVVSAYNHGMVDVNPPIRVHYTMTINAEIGQYRVFRGR